LMATFELTDVQAEAILNMRLRSLRKLEEIELRKEHAELTKEQGELQTLLASDKRQWRSISKEVEALKKAYPLTNADGTPHPLGARRTVMGTVSTVDLAEVTEAFIEREPITVILSEKGWIRAPRGHAVDVSDEKGFKAGDRLKLSIKCETTDKLLMLTTRRTVYTLAGA